MLEFGNTPPKSLSEEQALTTEQTFQRGLHLQKNGQFADAKKDYTTVLAVEPDHFGATYLLGLLYHQTGQQTEAYTYVSKAMALDPTFSEAHANLGNILLALQRYEEAVANFQRALTLTPDSPKTYYNMGIAYSEMGRLDEAVASFEQAIQPQPDYASAHNNLGNAYHLQGKLDEALASYQKVLTIDPTHRNAYFNMATIQVKQSALEEAEGNYRNALEIDPGYAEALSNLGNIFAATRRLQLAVETFDKAITLDPQLADIHANKGNALRSMGRSTEGISCFRNALSIDPTNIATHSNLIFTMGYAGDVAISEIRQEAERWDRQHGYRGEIQPHTNTLNPERQLRIGFVSGDLNDHPVSQFLCNILPELDAKKLELFAYSNSYKNDPITQRLKSSFAHWRDVPAFDDDQLADKIRADAIDILVDLSGHTSDNRLQMFTQQPAPVQVTWLGYGGTTGLKAMDYVLSDRHVIPPDQADHFTETPWPLPDIWVCFGPPEYDVEPGPLPALRNGYTTFGSFNNLAKITKQTIACWAQVLHAVADSRLYLKAIQLGDDAVQEDILKQFETHGIDHARLTLKGRTASPEGHLADYQQIDIALDPFPYVGGTTSVEAFWMGVPVLTKRGNRFVSNMGVSLALSVGLESWVAETTDDYVDKAQDFASDLTFLSEMRLRLRRQLVRSPLCNAGDFADNFETAMQSMWRRWCEAQ